MISRPARLGPKGQVVLPKEVRKALGLGPGDAVMFRLLNGEAMVVPIRRRDPKELHGIFAGRAVAAVDVRTERGRMHVDMVERHATSDQNENG